MKNNPPLTQKQKDAKADADGQLAHILNLHQKWRNNEIPKMEGQIFWFKLIPIFEIYEKYQLGLPDFRGTDMSEADFTGAVFPENTDFTGANLSNSFFPECVLNKVVFAKCNLEEITFFGCKCTDCDFYDAFAVDSRLLYSTFKNCNFRYFKARRASFEKSILDESKFRNADLSSAVFKNCISAIKTDFSGANLRYSMLSSANFSNAIMTGANLHGTARRDWKIENVECKYVYWDKNGAERFPPNRDYEDGQFTIENKQYKEFSYPFEEGITPFDLGLANHIVEKINKANMGFEIGIKDISVYSLNPTLHFIMLSGEQNLGKAKNAFQYVRDGALEPEDGNSDESNLPIADSDKAMLPAVSDITGFDFSLLSELGQNFIARTLENVSKKVSEFANQMKLENVHPKDLVGYEYIALWGTGAQEESLSNQQLAGMRTELESFMPSKCYLILDSELESLPEETYIKGLYSGFNVLPDKRAYFAIAELRPENSDQYVNRPIYHELTMTPRTALSRCLGLIRDSLKLESISDFRIPALHTTQRKMLCPDGPEILRLRGTRKPKEICQEQYEDPDGNLFRIAQTTLGRIEKSIPHSERIIQKIAWCYGVPIESISFTKIIPKAKTLQTWREGSDLLQEELAQYFGVNSPRFFDILERADEELPVDTLCFIQDRFCKLLDPKATKRSDSKEVAFEDLIDFEKSRQTNQ